MKDNFILKDKKILFFSQYFFGYERIIKEKLEELKAKVVMYNEMSVKTTFGRALTKICPNLFYFKTNRYYKRIINSNKANKFDFILFIDCEMPSKKVLKKMKMTFPNARLCLYLWDSVKNLNRVDRKFKFFDYITTFDREDAKKYNLILRPLFFSDEYRNSKINSKFYEYDLCFIGTIHSDRYRILKLIEKQAKDNNWKCFFYPYLQSKFVYYIYKLIKKEFRNTKISDFYFSKLSPKEITSIVNKSKVVVDIQHPDQDGLTMRTLEMIGMKKKILSTNADIINYDFYDSKYIGIIDRTNPVINSCLFSNSTFYIDEHIYENYSIQKWCVDVLGEM